MRVFGCAWKINFPENIFSWLCALMALTRKLVSVKIFTSNHFQTHTQRERERERKEEERAQIMPLTSTSPIYEPMNLSSTQSLRPMSLRLRRRPRAFAPRTNLRPFAFDPEPRTHEPISLSLCDFDFLCDFDRPTNPWAFDLWFFFLLLWWCGWWCFGGFPVVWWWVLCGWWWKIAFSECYQTHENIF